MAAMKSSMKMFMMMMFIVASMHMNGSLAQTTHVVGDALGWTIPPNGAADYTTWASQQTFNVGDTLLFNFTTGNHNVAEVSQAAYGPCTTADPTSITATGPATITLTAAGPHYYICTVGTHCQIGQKLAINVSAATPPPSSTPATPPPATAPITPPPATAPTTPPTSTPRPVSPPITTPSPAPTPSTTTTPPPTASPAPSPVGASPPTPTTSGPSPPDRTTPSPSSDTTPPPPSPSTAARSLTAVVPATFLTVALAFFY